MERCVDPTQQPGSDVTVIADSDPLVRWSLAHYLVRWFEVQTAATLADARRLVREFTPVALVVGDDFPDGAGRELVAEVIAAAPQTRIVRISASSEVREENGAASDGVTTLEKPFALADVAAIIGVDL
jgi:DNA-binding NtrC family response regulator